MRREPKLRDSPIISRTVADLTIIRFLRTKVCNNLTDTLAFLEIVYILGEIPHEGVLIVHQDTFEICLTEVAVELG